MPSLPAILPGAFASSLEQNTDTRRPFVGGVRHWTGRRWAGLTGANRYPQWPASAQHAGVDAAIPHPKATLLTTRSGKGSAYFGTPREPAPRLGANGFSLSFNKRVYRAMYRPSMMSSW
jgi:hypothetical protein